MRFVLKSQDVILFIDEKSMKLSEQALLAMAIWTLKSLNQLQQVSSDGRSNHLMNTVLLRRMQHWSAGYDQLKVDETDGRGNDYHPQGIQKNTKTTITSSTRMRLLKLLPFSLIAISKTLPSWQGHWPLGWGWIRNESNPQLCWSPKVKWPTSGWGRNLKAPGNPRRRLRERRHFRDQNSQKYKELQPKCARQGILSISEKTILEHIVEQRPIPQLVTSKKRNSLQLVNLASDIKAHVIGELTL